MTTEIQALFSKALHCQKQNELEKAVALYEKMLLLSPQHLEALHYLALALAQLGKMENAILYFKKALALSPLDENLHGNLANAYKKIGQEQEALNHYQKALRINPDYAPAHHNLAVFFSAKKEPQKALHHYRAAVHAKPDFLAAHYHLGLLLLKQGKFDAAKKQFTNVLSLFPEHLDAHFYLGILCLEDNHLMEAKNYFETVLSLDAEHTDALINLGVIALKQDEGQKAIEYFTKALALNEHHIEARNNLAATFMHFDRFENALMHYDYLLKNDPGNIEYLYNTGVAEMALGHLQEATQHFLRVLAQNDTHFASLTNMAAIYNRQEDYVSAIDFLKRALTVNPDDEAARFMLNALTPDVKNPAPSSDYVTNLFNNYALYYDKHMQETLNYTLPQHIAKVLHKRHCLHGNKTLDLGCGTGLSGVVLRELSHHLTGIDIAPKMLAHAREKGIYDELVESDLLNYLTTYRGERFDLAVAADVIPYLGDLTLLFKTLRQALTAQGLFIFTGEIASHDNWQLQSNARFCHHPDYIQYLCQNEGYAMVHQEKITARTQHQKAVSVMLYVLQVR